jgi:hypothetical protein
MRIESSVSVPTKNSHTLTILRAEGSTLPNIQVPPEPVLKTRRQLTAEEFARYAEERRRHLQFDAGAYDNGVSVVRWRHPDTGESYEAICGFASTSSLASANLLYCRASEFVIREELEVQCQQGF